MKQQTIIDGGVKLINNTGSSTHSNNVLWDYDGFIYTFVMVNSDMPTTKRVRVTLTKSGVTHVMGNTAYMPEHPRFFAINSYLHYEGGSSFRLTAGIWNYTVSGYDNNGNLLWEDDSDVYAMKNLLTTPTITGFDSDTNIMTVNAGSSGSNRCYLSIERASRPATKNGYTIKQRDYFYTCAMKGIERGKFYEGVPPTLFPSETKAYLRRWNPSSIRALVVFDNKYKLTPSGTTQTVSISSGTKNTCFGYVQEAVYILNSLNSDLQINLESSYETMPDSLIMIRGDLIGNAQKLLDYYVESYPYYDMIIRFGIEDSMYEPGSNYAGNWNISAWPDEPESGLGGSFANIAVDIDIEGINTKSTVFEEMLQSLGAGNDSYSEPDSLYFEIGNFVHPETYNELDLSVFEQLYASYSGWDAIDVLNNMETPCLLYRSAGSNITFDLSRLNNGQYIARAWIVAENDNYSLQTEEYAFTKGTARPPYFSWTYPKMKGGDFNLTKDEWNDFTANINLVRAYKGLPAYNFTTAVHGNYFTAAMYNEARAAIRGISGYGTYIPLVASGDDITADINSPYPEQNIINIIVDELNAIP